MKNIVKGNRIALLLVAIVAIGIFALPSTMAMFGGQHNWYDINPTGNQVPCVKCHADVYDEYGVTGAHATLGGGSTENDTIGITDPDAACHACHRVANSSIVYAEGDGTGSTPGEEAHAASTIACMECHEYGTDYVGPVIAAPFAGGFENMTNTPFDYTDDAVADSGLKAAHNDFVQGAIDDDLMEDSNEACLTCHTHVAIDINWTHAYKMKLDAVQDENGDWVCDDFITEGTYNISTYGNMTGERTGTTTPVADVDEPTGMFNSTMP
ncbi:MAG: cytochrome c3 family protein [Halobacteriota archaeon]|nr:cytochrome c3 family protein [Halobacteriota archaeon]